MKRLLVEMLVDRRGPDRHVGMNAAQTLEFLRAQRSCTTNRMSARAALLEAIDRRDGGVGGRDHRVDTTIAMRSARSVGVLKIVLDRDQRAGSR